VNHRMSVVFVSALPQPSPRWRAAFPDLVMMHTASITLEQGFVAGAICFFDVSLAEAEEAKNSVRLLSDAGLVVIVLSGQPAEAEAYGVLTAGARGYCHSEAVPEQLQEVAGVVSHGGFWMPPGLVQRLMASALKVAPDLPQPPPEGFDQLTEREYQVAMAVGKGANNKEIAEQLAVSERTVKAHLTSVFEKLHLRDRVQLALAVNRLPFH